MSDKCPFHPIEIPDSRQIIDCDKLNFPWVEDKKGYFLVKIEDDIICCGFVNNKHVMEIELKAKDPDKIIKEIAKRKLCDTQHMGYIASELMIAKNCIENNKKYVQR
jgi:hypothetical protein